MIASVYELLDVPRGLPGWKLGAKLHAVTAELLDAYGSRADIPAALSAGVAILQDQDERDQYDSFLEWSEDGDEVDFRGELDKMRAKAERYHFTLQEVGSGKVKVVNLGLPDVPPPPPPESLQERLGREAGPTVRAGKQDAAPQPSLDGAKHGLVNGYVPPVALGRRVFDVRFAEARLIHAVHQGSAIYLQWSQTNADGRTHTTAYTDYILTKTGLDNIRVGGNYWFTQFIDTQTNKCYDGAAMQTDRREGQVGPVILSNGLWDMFPWWMKFMDEWRVRTYYEAQNRYRDEYPDRYVAPVGYFGDEGWTAQTSAALKTFIYQADYWTRAAGSGWQVSPANCDRLAKEMVGCYCRQTIFSPKQLRQCQLS